MGAKNVCLMTDKNLSRLPPVQTVMDSFVKNGINFKVYDNVRVEPTDRRYSLIVVKFTLSRSQHIPVLIETCPRPYLMAQQFISEKPDIWPLFSLLQASWKLLNSPEGELLMPTWP